MVFFLSFYDDMVDGKMFARYYDEYDMNMKDICTKFVITLLTRNSRAISNVMLFSSFLMLLGQSTTAT